eukprot:37326-Pyramimonas_sp.AAC.1
MIFHHIRALILRALYFGTGGPVKSSGDVDGALDAVGLPVQAAVTVPAEDDEVLENVQHARELAEQHHAVARLLQALQQA